MYSPEEGVAEVRYGVTLTTKALANFERDEILFQYRERLTRLEQEIGDLTQITMTNRMLWRSYVLACFQIHREIFMLDNMGFLLLANGVPLGTEQAQLHEFMQTFLTLTQVPAMGGYDRLPNAIQQQEEHVPEPE